MAYENVFSDKETFKNVYAGRVAEKFGRSVEESHIYEKYMTLGQMIRDYSSIAWKETKEKVQEKGQRQMVYFSMEFLIGRMMKNNLMNLGIYDVVKDGLKDLDISLDDLLDVERDAGLGNGGLGRLAACFMDSLASLGYPSFGNTIRYKYGFFKQRIVDNKQIEVPDNWLSIGNPWEIRKPKHAVSVKFYGRVATHPYGESNRYVFSTEDAECVKAVPYDMPMIGYGGKTVNTLRCWAAEPDIEQLPPGKDFGKYLHGVEEINQCLYPDDSNEHGKILRLKQQYFFVAAGIAAQVRTHMRVYKTISNIHEKLVFQLNDTHPAIAVAEMMRILLDEFYLEWDEAWNIVTHMMAYTNHTVLAEALEKWPVDYIRTLLPRIYMILEEINRRFIAEARSKGVAEHRINKMSVIHDGQVHMANLAIIGSFSVNGVAALHTEILKNQEMREFYEYYPSKFNNKTNGITHRRFLAYANPELTAFCKKYCGDVVKDITLIKNLEKVADDPSVQDEFLAIKKQRKEIFIDYLKNYKNTDCDINPDSIFDVQIKRLHAYKRQLLNCLHIIYLYQRIKNEPDFTMVPRTFIFGAKAAPSYAFAKNVIELINCMARRINNDPQANKFMKVIFVENYDVSSAEYILPASDVSEQISMAGKEASGTGNMKFMINGALTLGTLDGANVEIAEHAGYENCFIFGLKANEALDLKNSGTYSAISMMSQPVLYNAMGSLIDGTWDENKNRFRTIFDEIVYKNDEYLTLADFEAYVKEQQVVEETYKDRRKWAKMCLMNIANSAYFSSDRTIEEYVADIWKLERVD